MYCCDNKTDGYWFKIPDGTMGRNPYDIYGLLPNTFFAIEAKVCRQKTKINFPSLFNYGKQFHELLNLKKVSMLNFSAWVIVCCDRSNKQHRAFAIKVGKAIEYYKAGSIPISQVEEECIELPRKHRDRELLYDLTPIFNGL